MPGLFGQPVPRKRKPVRVTASGSPPVCYAVVALERSIDRGALDAGLTYGADEVLHIGQHVEAPLGNAREPVGGVVVRVGDDELLGDLDASRVRRIARVGDRVLTPRLVELGVWLARYYRAPLGLTLASMAPAPVRQSVGKRTRVIVEIAPDAPEEAEGSLKPAARRAWAALGSVTLDDRALDAGELARLAGATNRGPINQLIRAGLLRERTIESVVVDDDGDLPGARDHEPGAKPELTTDQRDVLGALAPGLGGFGVSVLRGVTGSGKTEVYLRAIERVLDAGRSAIVLTPEIALTPQTAGRFRARFGPDRVTVLHSALTGSQRRARWMRAARGDARVVVGPRSAVFAPLADLGLIVVDEEHDGSYKQDRAPRYHARDVAVKRAQLEGASVILGSATPSLESISRALDPRSPAALLNLPKRVSGGAMPRVELVDLAHERAALAASPECGAPIAPRDRAIGPTLAGALAETLGAGEQAILLLNRRGFASYLACSNTTSCGWSMRCDRCDTGVVLHHRHTPARGGVVRCHHCHAEQLPPRACPSCGAKLMTLGAGTQRAEDELQWLFSEDGPEDLRRTSNGATLVEGATLRRLDSDAMRSARDYFEALDRFARGDARVLLGTQMIAKGLDFPSVTLVGVLSADIGLASPDFRASERAFQLLAQVAGRAGRGDAPGRVIAQTFDPEDETLVLASRHDYPTFARRELETRRLAALPPATRLARILCRDEDPQRADALARNVAKAVRDAISATDTGDARVEGPMTCPIARLNDEHRVSVEVFAGAAAPLAAVLDVACERDALRNPGVAVDVDPIDLL